MSGPLDGLRILVTRAGSQARAMKQSIESQGGTAVHLPVIHFGHPASWQALDTALAEIGSYNWIIFASANAVSATIDRAGRLSIDIAAAVSSGLRVAAIGSATAEALETRKIRVAYRPARFVAEDFVESFPGRESLSGSRILWPRTNAGRTLIKDELDNLGACVNSVEAYTTQLPPDSEELGLELVNMLNNHEIDVVTFASSQTVKNFSTLIGTARASNASDLLASVKIATIGPITAATARDILGRVDIEAQEEFTITGLLTAIADSRLL